MEKTLERPVAAPPNRRLPRPLLYGGGALLAVVLLAIATMVGLRLARPGALPGTTVYGTNVGGLQGEQLRDAVVAAGRGDDVVTITRGTAAFTSTGAELGYSLDAAATVAAVLERGRQLNPVAALSDHIRAFTGTTSVEPVHTVDDEQLRQRVAESSDVLNIEPVEGTVTFSGTSVERVDPSPGAIVRTDELAADVREALLESDELIFEAPADAVEPETTVAAVDAVAAQAEQAVSDAVELSRDGTTITFTPEDIAGMLTVEQDGAVLSLAIPAAAISRHVPAGVVSALEEEPTDATIAVSGGAVSITQSSDGFAFDPEATAAQLLEIATSTGSRTAELEGEILEPELSTEDAEALGITEQVSSFTTEHACCQGRVTNIQRMADLVDGVLIRPGETFSVNGHVGERTAARGFVLGGAIQSGEFVDELGGGVSQFATTLYNAAYFGGYAIPDFKAHSYYISRYPAGREATLNYPNVDLKIRNNSPHGLIIKTSYTSTSITVAMYGTKWVEVDSISGERRNPTSPETRTVENPALPRGSQRVKSEGRGGFDITVTRVLRFPDGREEREPVVTRYLAEPRVIERNSSSAPPPPAQESSPPPQQSSPPPQQDPPPEEEQPPPAPPEGDGDG
jgi:vancomycin resistance protein YoaR